MLLVLLALVVFVTDEVAVIMVFGVDVAVAVAVVFTVVFAIVVAVVDAVDVEVFVDGVNVSDFPLGFCRLLDFIGESMLTDLVLRAGRFGLMSLSSFVDFGISGIVDTNLLFGPVDLDPAFGMVTSSTEVCDGVLCFFGIFFTTTPISV